MRVNKYSRIEQVDLLLSMSDVYEMIEAKYRAQHPESGDFNISLEFDPYSGCNCSSRPDGMNVRFKIGHYS